MAHYTGASGKNYTLSQQLAAGGEGIVYDISGDSAHVAKIYKQGRFTSEVDRNTMERKLKAMLAMNIPATVDGLLRLAWPQDILYENGKLVGFIMPRITTKYKIFDVYRTGKNSIREREYTNYTWKYSVQFAYNMAWVVNYLHSHNIVIGDLNQNNIAVDAKSGAVILIDCDSFDIRDPRTNEHFPCVVGLEEMLAPELQTVGSLRNGKFTKESDNFSLAIHIFRLLMNNEDPFGGAMTTNASQSSIPGNRSIINGECLYVRDVPGKKWLPRMPKLDVMPASIQRLFQKTFNYTATTALSRKNGRATAAEWVNALAVLSAPEPNLNLRTCSVNTKHVYPAHNASCPWCTIEKAMQQQMPVPVQHTPKNTYTPPRTTTPPTTTSSSVSTSASSSQQKAASQTGPVRRSPYLFYIVLILFGVGSGFVFGDMISTMVYDAFDVYMGAGTATGILAVIGLIAGAWMAHHFEDDYTHANNGITWLLLGFVAMLIPLLVAIALGIVAAIVMFIIGVIVSILAIILGIAIACSVCSGS